MLTVIPQNSGNRFQKDLKWDQLFLKYLTNTPSGVYDLALMEMNSHDSIHDFSKRVRKSLWYLFTRQANPLLDFYLQERVQSEPVIEPGFCKPSARKQVMSDEPSKRPRGEIYDDMEKLMERPLNPTPEDEPVAGPSRPREPKKVVTR